MPGRIAHVISTRYGIGGAESFLGSLIRAGTQDGWQQLVLNPFADVVPGSVSELSQYVEPVPYRNRACTGLMSVPLMRHWLRSELSRFQPDVVHVLLFHASATVASLRRSPRRATMVTNVYGAGLRVLPHAWALEPIDRWAGRRFDRVAAISESVRQFLIEEYRYPPELVSCIPLGWQGEPLAPSTEDRPPTVVCVGGLRPEKGHSVLLAAFARVRCEVPTATLVLVGHGAMHDELLRHATRLGLSESVRITGSVPSVWPYLAEADVFASASLTEAYGIAVVEAMAAGLPVVASAVGGIPELVVPGVTGELFPSGDDAALAKHLVRLLRSPQLRSAMGAAATEAAKSLNMAASVRRYLAVCEQLVAASRPAGVSWWRGRTWRTDSR